jgi:very-short-patch-repair endonuclease
MPDAEQRLWYHLRAGRFQGWKFRRQVPLGRYVVDFLCEDARLIVEVDGGQHAEQIEQDSARTQWLSSQGYAVMRFWNNDALANIEGVLATLSRPSPKGEGAHSTMVERA